MSTFQFASNSPIMGIDWDGLEMRDYKSVQKDGTTVITRVVDLKVVNSANLSQDQINSYEASATKQITEAFGGSDTKTKTTVKVEVKYTQVAKADPGKDFYVEFTNELQQPPDAPPLNSNAVAVTDKQGNTETNRMQVTTDGTAQDVGNSITHELGHAAGLGHPDDNGGKPIPGNLMNAGGTFGNTPTDLNKDQLKTVSNTIADNMGKNANPAENGKGLAPELQGAPSKSSNHDNTSDF